MRYILKPLSYVFIILKGIEICPFSVGFVVSDLAFIDATVVKNVSALAFGFTRSKGTLVVGAIFEEKLTAAMEFLVGPLTSIVSFRFAHLLIAITEDTLGEQSFVFEFIVW